MAVYQTDTENKLSKALWTLMEKERLDDITILQICQEANVGRRSFYRHFGSKDDIIEYGFRLKAMEYAALNTRCKTMEDMIGLSFRYFKKERRYICLIKENNLTAKLYEIMQDGDLFAKQLNIYMQRAGIPVRMRAYVANAIAATHTSLLLTWVEHGFSDDWHELVQFEMAMFSVMAE